LVQQFNCWCSLPGDGWAVGILQYTAPLHAAVGSGLLLYTAAPQGAVGSGYPSILRPTAGGSGKWGRAVPTLCGNRPRWRTKWLQIRCHWWYSTTRSQTRLRSASPEPRRMLSTEVRTLQQLVGLIEGCAIAMSSAGVSMPSLPSHSLPQPRMPCSSAPSVWRQHVDVPCGGPAGPLHHLPHAASFPFGGTRVLFLITPFLSLSSISLPLPLKFLTPFMTIYCAVLSIRSDKSFPVW